MSEERLLVLKMVESGKISAQEGIELLEAMEEPKEEKPDKAQDAWRRIEKHGEEFTQKVEKAAERLGQSIEMKIEETGLSEQLTNLSRLFSKTPFIKNMTTEVHQFSEIYTGNFDPDLEEIPISLSHLNGVITVEGWDQDGYQLEIVQKIRAKEREAALDKVLQIELPQHETVGSLDLKIKDQKEVTISFHLFIPRKRPYLLNLKSTNGKCSVINILGKRIDVNTVNGSIMVKQSKADTILAATANGSNVLDYVEGEIITQSAANGSVTFVGSAKKIACDTVNGSIKIAPLTFAYPNSEVKINAINGSVRCVLPKIPDLQAKIDAASAIGRVNVRLPNFVSATEEKSGGRHSVVGEIASETETSEGENSKTIAINARSRCGSITIDNETSSHGSK